MLKVTVDTEYRHLAHCFFPTRSRVYKRSRAHLPENLLGCEAPDVAPVFAEIRLQRKFLAALFGSSLRSQRETVTSADAADLVHSPEHSILELSCRAVCLLPLGLQHGVRRLSSLQFT